MCHLQAEESQYLLSEESTVRIENTGGSTSCSVNLQEASSGATTGFSQGRKRFSERGSLSKTQEKVKKW